VWGIGLAVRDVDLNTVPMGTDAHSWVLRSDGVCIHDTEVIHRLNCEFEPGDVIGCCYDHVSLRFFLNGKNLDAPIMAKGKDMYAVFYVDEGAIVDCAFNKFHMQVPQGFTQIMVEHSLF